MPLAPLAATGTLTGSSGKPGGVSSDAVRQAFVARFGHAPRVVTQAPGRVNLIGEHTDYNEGFVFPAAIDRYVWAAASPVDGPSVFESLELEADSGWLAYPEGVAWALRHAGHSIPNLHAVASGNVPIGAGVSSSAALELAFAVAWNEIGGDNLTSMELAKIGRACENDYIGVQTGLMDQVASAFGKAGHALFFDTFTGEIQYAPMPPDIAIVVADTTQERALAGSKYNERRAECEEAARILGVRALRHATMGELEDAADLMPEPIYRRARHVISENRRCVRFAAALETGDLDQVGSLMRASHESLRDDYEVSGPELDAMAEACWASTGCIGARMTGAGFGGCCVALIDRSASGPFLDEAARRYRTAAGVEGRFMVCEAADGARRVA